MGVVMIKIIVLGVLALNLTLARVAEKRNTYYNENLNYKDYECLIGVQHEDKELLGEEVYFYNSGNQTSYGPFLVVDMAQKKHEDYMPENGIAADINCEEFVHHKGYLYVKKHNK